MDVKCLNLNKPARILITMPSESKRAIIDISLIGIEVFNDKCKHRGGPIHLCYKDKQNDDRCPWHDHKIRNRKKIDYICAVYISSTGILKMVNNQVFDVPWPVKILS